MWSKKTLKNDQVYFWQIETLQLWVKKLDKVWSVASEISPTNIHKTVIAEEVKDPGHLTWNHVVSDKNNSLTIAPAFPDRPLVIKPSHSFQLMPGKHTLIYIPIPVWIQLYSGSVKHENLFFEAPTQVLSSTWFGEPDAGMLAYALPDDLSEQAEANTVKVTCPVKISNETSDILDIQRLLLHGEFLNIYSDNKALYSNEVHMKYKGENTASDLQYANRPPSFLTSPEPLAKARSVKPSGVFSKSFHFIKSLTDY